jgi:DNA-directed RNA polymerase specialized sigma24 family protein
MKSVTSTPPTAGPAPMTPAEEAQFIQLWQQGASYATIAQALGIPAGTVSSRAKRLAEQGKIQPRPPR